jgi:VIT1/CCC1 family predicted Fe2+/Mn2+ transporter
MRYIVLLLILLIFGCSIEKRVHRPGFHFKKHAINDNSKKESNTTQLEIRKAGNSKENSNQTPIISHIKQIKAKDKKDILEKSSLKKDKTITPSVNIEKKSSGVNLNNFADTPIPTDKKKELDVKKNEPDEESSGVSIIANILAIMGFVFALLAIISTLLAFLLSLSLVLPFLSALAGFFSSGFSFLIDLISKSNKFKSRLALFGLITALIFFAFFFLVLAGVILI